MVPRDRIRWAEGPIRVPLASEPGYAGWVELNPRDSIVITVDDSSVVLTQGGLPPLRWLTDGAERSDVDAHGMAYRLTAEWKKNELVLSRREVGGRPVPRRFKLTKDGVLELTFPGIVRNPAYPTKYRFERRAP